MDDPPLLKPPADILRRLAARVSGPGRAEEKTYLRSLNPRHRWARSSFADLEEEFRYKTIWVAKRIRDQLGSPNHSAFRALGDASVRGVRAAAWFIDSRVGYVIERRVFWSRRHTRVILGAVDPGRGAPWSGTDDLDARDAVWAVSRIVIH